MATEKIIMDGDKEILREVSILSILGTCAAFVRMLLTYNETAAQKIRGFFAGIILAGIAAYAVQFSTLSYLQKIAVVIFLAAFIPKLWPIIELYALKWANKKGKNVAGNDSD